MVECLSLSLSVSFFHLQNILNHVPKRWGVVVKERNLSDCEGELKRSTPISFDKTPPLEYCLRDLLRESYFNYKIIIIEAFSYSAQGEI